MSDRPQKITFADMRDMGVRGLLIYCSDYKCSHLVTPSGDRWPDNLRLSAIEPQFVCQACEECSFVRTPSGSRFSLTVTGATPPHKHGWPSKRP
jgi:hypothetical protein